LADPFNVKAVFLLGHVPAPYSGNLAPDDHPDHRGAWPADAYYGDMDGIWTDSVVNNLTASDPRNRNVPGDGKFDQSHTPAPLALQVGRVDLADLPTLPTTELDALRLYLGKDHAFRHKLSQPDAGALIDDNFGILNGEVPAANGWANFAAFVGAENVVSGRWLTDLTRNHYLWAYGCGSGTYTGATGVASTSHFLVYDINVVFTMLFGSYFGDWDSQDNFMRAALAATPDTLTAAWTGRPDWYFHHMALGETIGFSARLSQNNSGLYQPNSTMNGFYVGRADPSENWTGVHIALMGDPTLRLQPVAPPVALIAFTNDAGGVDLTWQPSLDTVLGYNVYRSASPGGPYSRLNAALITANAYTDPDVSSDTCYMVRAVRLETSSSGSYYNASQGAFATVDLTSSGSQTNLWAGQGLGSWKINDAAGAAGSNPGWDCLTLDGTLRVTATASNQFTVQIVSATADNTPGPPAHFNYDQSYSWPIVTASGGIAGFDPTEINLRTTDFKGDLAGGVFSLALSGDGDSVNLVFTPNEPPIANPAWYSRDWDQPMRIQISDLLQRFTSDPDGDPRALVEVGSSTNGTAISTDGSVLVFAATNNVTETVSYWVQDVRAYRAGDTVRTAHSTLTIDPLPKGLHFDAYHAIELEWQGDPGQLYQLQSRLETESQWTNQGDPVEGTGQKASFFERASSLTKFYRIILVQ
jgi:Bacterial Ig domain